MISICIPTYNRLSSLKQCLESIFEGFKTYPYEVIIADGGSKDGTIEYIKNLDKNNVKLIEQGELKGVTKSYNESFKIADGEYIYPGNDDTIIKPKVIIKACKILDEDDQIGLVAPKDQEVVFGNFPGVTIKMRQYWTLLGKFHIFRSDILKKINYFDESLRTYYSDDDSCLSVLQLGYSYLFTKEVGMIHYRYSDEEVKNVRTINRNKKINEKELAYIQKKWEKLKFKIYEYLKPYPTKKRKALYFSHFCSKTYHSKILKYLVSKGLYDFCLKQSVVFNDKKYNKLKDFYLAQRYPDDILN